MISIDDYFAGYPGNKDITDDIRLSAQAMLDKVNQLLDRAQDDGIVTEVNPKTKSRISGSLNGGWRPLACPVGALNSKHKSGHAVDVYDPDNDLDDWCGRNIDALEELGLYLEAEKHTPGWCHIQDIPPASGRRFFIP